ncbi:FAD-dependent monooxygenase, partial [Mesorhizobium sp. M5C.F.Ca.IN.020.32.2.1]|uniref:FAD-dependent oxidoreductase n=1 Tax=Mesorhizobium sp. M5C.F.Ca.IN.020.32.2.1 TaxID=2496771 RepID=UPI0013E2CE0B
MRAVIIGAGIAGLAVAKGLRLLGWETEIYEQASELKPLGAGLSLSANALRALRTLGLYEAVVAEAQPIHRLDLLDDKGQVLQSTDFQRFSQQYGHLSMAVLHRGDLQRPVFRNYHVLSSAPKWNAWMLGRLATTSPCALRMGRLWKASWCSLAMAFTPRFVERCFRNLVSISLATLAGEPSRPVSRKEWTPRVLPKAGEPENASDWPRSPAKGSTGLLAVVPITGTTPSWLRPILQKCRRCFPDFTS